MQRDWNISNQIWQLEVHWVQNFYQSILQFFWSFFCLVFLKFVLHFILELLKGRPVKILKHFKSKVNQYCKGFFPSHLTQMLLACFVCLKFSYFIFVNYFNNSQQQNCKKRYSFDLYTACVVVIFCYCLSFLNDFNSFPGTYNLYQPKYGPTVIINTI